MAFRRLKNQARNPISQIGCRLSGAGSGLLLLL